MKYTKIFSLHCSKGPKLLKICRYQKYVPNLLKTAKNYFTNSKFFLDSVFVPFSAFFHRAIVVVWIHRHVIFFRCIVQLHCFHLPSERLSASHSAANRSQFVSVLFHFFFFHFFLVFFVGCLLPLIPCCLVSFPYERNLLVSQVPYL